MSSSWMRRHSLALMLLPVFSLFTIFFLYPIFLVLVSFLMPIAIFSLMGSLWNIDPVLEEASSSLGASEARTFIRVTFPLSVPGLAAASLLCFTVGITAFVTPQVLGGGIV